jgi:hypothetical protein
MDPGVSPTCALVSMMSDLCRSWSLWHLLRIDGNAGGRPGLGRPFAYVKLTSLSFVICPSV